MHNLLLCRLNFVLLIINFVDLLNYSIFVKNVSL